jgi:hypothetical protein
MVENARTARRGLELLDKGSLDRGLRDKDLLDKDLLGRALPDKELLDKRSTQLMESLDQVRTSCPDGKYQAYQAGMAPVTGPLFFLRMQPLSIEPLALIPAATPRRPVAGRAKLGRNRRDH